MGLNPKGRDWGSLVNWDDLGKAYAGFIIAWTAILFAGIAWMIRNRNLPLVRMRNVPVAIASVIFLHVYLVKILLAYTTNGHFLCSAEFWIMSIYLPFGIALFQANLAQLYSISEQQKKLLSSAASVSSLLSRRSRNPLKIWNSLSQLKKTYVYIGLGMLIQFVISAVLYATTPELQGDWRSYGKVTHAKGQALCRKSLQWIPSAFWQLLWSWVFGLYTLYKIRNIRDTHYWRLGTWLCIISGLPGTPLWLAAVFNISWKPVNIRWVPPMWLAPGILVMQIVTIFFPIYEAYESRRQMRTTLSAIKDWEEKGRGHTSHSSSMNTSSDLSKPSSYGISTQSKEIFSMASLEKALAINPMPLLHFAANKDFTAENIIFLMRVREWRQAWTSAPRDPSTGDVTSHARNLLFRLAVEIYMVCVLDTISEFPINIDHSVRLQLDLLFEPAVPEAKKRVSSDTDGSNPFDIEMNYTSNTHIDEEVKRIALTREESDDSLKKATTVAVYSVPPTPTREDDDDEKPIFEQNPAVTPLGSARAKIRDGFDEKVFDAAEASIKYLVLTNTWRKFAQEAQQSSSNVDLV
ncbi:hypothetical protein HII31_05203 [Pseudocercospora fuligena]|uniref:RGS domain-containing protein n=1 Tax=Pseudocercospora fuligena TaxID=685502 RepID=A0A8H6VIA0_9PEZI|nr:hypothetical protein HII31_05203 [Pseudocercospora fuligena]